MKRAFLIALTMLAVNAAIGSAQTTTQGSIRGYIKDEQGAVLPGVSVTAKSDAGVATRTATTDEDGYYRLQDLPPGTYTVTAELSGFSKSVREGVIVRAGINFGVDLTMKVGAITESVEVSGEAPMLEISNAVQGTNVSGDFQRKLPLTARRHWSDFMGMIPGSVGTSSPVYQGGFYYIHGADFESLSMQVDGVDIGSTQQSAPLYIGLSSDSLADSQVKTGAIDASAPLGMGAAISVITQSGTNKLKGTATFAWQPRQWIDNNNPGGTVTAIEVVEPEFSLGGPILKDRLWFFGSYRHIYNSAGLARTPQQLADLKAVVPDFEPFNNETDAEVYFIKANSQLSSKHQMHAFYNYDVTPAGTNGSTSAEPYTNTYTGGHAVAGKLTSIWSSSFTTRIGAGWNNKAFQIKLLDDASVYRPVYRTTLLASGRLSGQTVLAVTGNGRTNSATQPYSKTTFSFDANYYKSGWAGSHEFQAGVYAQPKLHQETQLVYVNGGASLEDLVLRDPNNPSGGTIPFHRQIWDSVNETNSLVDFSDYAVYVQDAWRPIPRLTINAGVRLDRIRRHDKLFDLEVQNSLEVGPRIGVNYILTEDRRNIIRAGFARVSDTPTINKASAGTNTIGYRDEYDLDLNGTFETTLITPGSTRLVPNRVIDEDYHQQYVRELTVGYRRQLPGQVSVDAGFINREYRDRTTLVDQNGIYENGVFKGYKNEALNEIYLLTNNEWNRLVYRALELQASKQTERLQLLASYTHVWRHIAGTWQPNDPASFIQPDAFANDKGIGGVYSPTSVSQDGNSLTGTHMTFDNQGWVDNVLNLSAAYQAPWDIIVATNYKLYSGLYSGPVVTRLPAGDPQFGPPTVTLSNGRVVSNPLATPIRFAYPTRGEGQLQAPNLHFFNVRVGKDFRFGSRRIETAVDFFNLGNLATDTGFMSGANQQYSPNYTRTANKQNPRSAQLTLRFVF